MEKRKLGKSGIEFAPIAFGGNVFGWTADEATSHRLLDAFVDLPFALPTAVAGISLAALYAPNGWFGEPLANFDVKIAFTPGRVDATQAMTDVESFGVLEPTYDGFRNYSAHGPKCPAEELLIDRAALLTLSAPEMTVLVGGLRVLGVNHGGNAQGVFTHRCAHRSASPGRSDRGTTDGRRGTARGYRFQ